MYVRMHVLSLEACTPYAELHNEWTFHSYLLCGLSKYLKSKIKQPKFPVVCFILYPIHTAEFIVNSYKMFPKTLIEGLLG